LLDLRTAVPIARQRGHDLSSAGGGEAEEHMGFGPIRLADRYICGLLEGLCYGLDPFSRPDHRYVEKQDVHVANMKKIVYTFDRLKFLLYLTLLRH
jgi:hypothetical protein